MDAKRVGNEIKIKEKNIRAAYYDEPERTEVFEYTFKLDKDGMYSFVSRKKVS